MYLALRLVNVYVYLETYTEYEFLLILFVIKITIKSTTIEVVRFICIPIANIIVDISETRRVH